MDDVTLIHSYTRVEAILDGVLIDCTLADLGEVTSSHTTAPVAMTTGLFALIERAVSNERHANDWKGVWHDIMWMSAPARRALALDGFAVGERLFVVIITGCGRVRNHVLKVALSPDEHGRPCWTYMLRGED